MLIAPPPNGVAPGTITVAVTDEPPGGLPAPSGRPLGGLHLSSAPKTHQRPNSNSQLPKASCFALNRPGTDGQVDTREPRSMKQAGHVLRKRTLRATRGASV